VTDVFIYNKHINNFICFLQYNHIINRIKEVYLREEGVKQTGLAEKPGKSFKIVNSLSCKSHPAPLETLYPIAEILQVSVKDLMVDNKEEKNKLGLNAEEKAFYDALTKPGAVQDFYSNDILVEMTKELTDMLRKNRTIDWQKKESARAEMRKLVKRLLRKYKYPPEESENAMEVVLRQCEEWTDSTSGSGYSVAESYGEIYKMESDNQHLNQVAESSGKYNKKQ
jgi:transcriptional regulator with XRE-family HTH domain